MIEAISGKGVNRVRAVCDGCGREDVLPCDYLNRSGGAVRPNVGQAHKKLTRQGWAVRGEKLHCPACVARERAAARLENEEPQDMAKAAVKEKTPSEEPPREPGYRMIGMICDMLNVAYDRAAKRYTNPADNDRTIAEAIGEGCMWGWVARIREAEYGPDMRWAEIDAIRTELAAAIRDANARTEKVADEVDARIREAGATFEVAVETISADLVARIEALQKRVNALDPSIGSRSGKA